MEPNENSPAGDQRMVEVELGRIIIRDRSERQYIYLHEREGGRGFPIIIGTEEAHEIKRVVRRDESPRPRTHQLCFAIVEALDAELKRADIVRLHQNTFYAQLVLQSKGAETTAVVDARPSDAIALALRAGAQIRVAEVILEQVRTDESGPDPLPPLEPDEPEEPDEPGT